MLLGAAGVQEFRGDARVASDVRGSIPMGKKKLMLDPGTHGPADVCSIPMHSGHHPVGVYTTHGVGIFFGNEETT